MAKVLQDNFAHWAHRFPGMQQSANDFYKAVQVKLEEQKLERLYIDRVSLFESGIFSAQREYLEVASGDYCFHLCAAPYGNGFFVSWWAGSLHDPFKRFMEAIPLIGRFCKHFVWPPTYYKTDVGLMFQSLVGATVEEVIDTLISEQGLKALTAEEKKPTMRDFFQ